MSAMNALGAAFGVVGFISFMTLTYLALLYPPEDRNPDFPWLATLFIWGAVSCLWVAIMAFARG